MLNEEYGALAFKWCSMKNPDPRNCMVMFLRRFRDAFAPETSGNAEDSFDSNNIPQACQREERACTTGIQGIGRLVNVLLCRPTVKELATQYRNHAQAEDATLGKQSNKTTHLLTITIY